MSNEGNSGKFCEGYYAEQRPDRTETSVSTLSYRYDRMCREYNNLLGQIDFFEGQHMRLELQLRAFESMRDDDKARSSSDSAGRDRLLSNIARHEQAIEVKRRDMERVKERIAEEERNAELKLQEVETVKQRLMGEQVNTHSRVQKVAEIYEDFDVDSIDAAFDLFGGRAGLRFKDDEPDPKADPKN